MADNYNISTTQGQANEAEGLDQNNPAMTYVDFANQIAKNSASQQLQNNAVQQAQLMLQQKQQLAAAGVNPEAAGYLTVSEAVGELTAAKVDPDLIQQFVDSLNGQQMVNRQSVDAIIHQKQFSAKPAGQGKMLKKADPITLPPGMKAEDMGLIPDPTLPGIGHVPSDGVYTVTTDQAGQPAYYISEGETPPEKPNTKATDNLQKRQSALVAYLAKQLEARRGNWMSQGMFKCSIALQKLEQTQFMTKQDLVQVAMDIASLFTQGAPTEDEIALTSYHTQLGNILSTLNSWGGMALGLPLTDIKNKLMSVVQPLYQELVQRYTNLIDLQAQGYQDVIQANPAWWEETKQKALTAAEGNKPVGTAITATGGNLTPIGTSGTTPTGGTPAKGASATTPTVAAPASNNDPLGIR